MKYRILGDTGLVVSELCLGTMTFGGQVEEAEAIRLIHCGMDNGVNFIDTANSYFGGQSEICVGKALQGRRERVILATKAGFKVGEGSNDKGLSRTHVMKQIDLSLQRLKTDYIDIYFMHLPDHVTPIEEVLETYNMLIDSGKIRYIGMSNFSAWEYCEAIYTSKMKGLQPPSVAQMVYNLLTRGLEQEFIPFSQAKNLGLMVYNPLAGGLLSGRYTRWQDFPQEGRFATLKSYGPRYWTQQNFSAIEKLTTLASNYDMSMTEMAMRWCAFQPGVSSVITGVSRESQLLQNLKSLQNGPLPETVYKECDALWDQISGKRFAYNR